MKRNQTHVVLLLAMLLVGINLLHAQDSLGPKPKRARTPDDYKHRTLKQISSKGSSGESRAVKDEPVVLYGDILPSRVRVIYTSSKRPIPQLKKDVLRKWAQRYAGSVEFYTRPYETELLFVEKKTKYWLAVKTQALPQLEQELKQGDPVDLFLIRVGAARISGKWEHMLLVERFQKPK